MPDSLYKGNELKDEKTSLTIHKLGPEEKFAGTVLKSLKEKIEDARKELESVKDECQRLEEEAEEEKERILREAREEADQIIQEAENEAEQIISARDEEVEEAREEGYDDGYEQAVEDAQEETAELIEMGEQILDEARRERNAFVAQLDDEFVSLVSRLAERVVRETVGVDPEVVLRVVQDTVDQVREVRKITIVLHPEDYSIIEEVVDELRDQHPSLQEITLVEDHKMDRGGCRINTEFGDLEGTISGQIQHLTDQLLAGDIASQLSTPSQEENDTEDSAREADPELEKEAESEEVDEVKDDELDEEDESGET